MTIIYVVIQIVLLAKLSSGNYVIQESLLGAYIGTQLLLFGLHAAVWHYLPAAQLRWVRYQSLLGHCLDAHDWEDTFIATPRHPQAMKACVT